MAEEDKPKRVEVGFEEGPVLVLRLAPDRIQSLIAAVQDEEAGWETVASEDSEVLLDLGEVIFIKVEAGEHRIGFAGS